MYWGDQIRKNEVERICGMHGGEQRCIQCLVGNFYLKRPHGTGKCMWKDNTKMDHKNGMGGCGQDSYGSG